MAKQEQTTPAHLVRMLQERAELNEKLSALTNFTRGEAFHKLTFRQQTLLSMQLSAMQTYSQILGARIHNEQELF